MASLELWNQEKVCWTQIEAVHSLWKGCNLYPCQVVDHNESGVGWCIVLVELPTIGNQRSFLFEVSVRATKDFFVENSGGWQFVLEIKFSVDHHTVIKIGNEGVQISPGFQEYPIRS